MGNLGVVEEATFVIPSEARNPCNKEPRSAIGIFRFARNGDPFHATPFRTATVLQQMLSPGCSLTRRRWIADWASGDRAVLVGEHAAHLARVLRAHVGQEFDIAVESRVRKGTVVEVTPERIEFQLGEEINSSSTLGLILLLAIFKFDRMEWAIEKCTEIGALRIVPVAAQRSETHLVAAAMKRVERWRRLALQAAEQSRRAAPPTISDPTKIKDALAEAAPTRIVLAESETQLTLKQAINDRWTGGEIALAVGPEGGWTAHERDLFLHAGWIPATLGSNILRAETAAIAALVIASSEIS